MKSSQSNFKLRSPGSYLARSYLIATVRSGMVVLDFVILIDQAVTDWSIKVLSGHANASMPEVLTNDPNLSIKTPSCPSLKTQEAAQVVSDAISKQVVFLLLISSALQCL